LILEFEESEGEHLIPFAQASDTSLNRIR